MSDFLTALIESRLTWCAVSIACCINIIVSMFYWYILYNNNVVRQFYLLVLYP